MAWPFPIYMASALQKSLSLCLFLLLFRYFVSFSSVELSHRRLNPQLELVRGYKLGAGRRSQENIYKVSYFALGIIIDLSSEKKHFKFI